MSNLLLTYAEIDQIFVFVYMYGWYSHLYVDVSKMCSHFFSYWCAAWLCWELFAPAARSGLNRYARLLCYYIQICSLGSNHLPLTTRNKKEKNIERCFSFRKGNCHHQKTTNTMRLHSAPKHAFSTLINTDEECVTAISLVSFLFLFQDVNLKTLKELLKAAGTYIFFAINLMLCDIWWKQSIVALLPTFRSGHWKITVKFIHYKTQKSYVLTVHDFRFIISVFPRRRWQVACYAGVSYIINNTGISRFHVVRHSHT